MVAAKVLIMLVGFPRSGKTTWALKRKVPIVNPDAIRLALHGHPFIGDAEPMVWAMARYMVKALFLAGHETVILDACNNTRKRRDPWADDAWVREFVVMNTPAEVCVKRVMDRYGYIGEGGPTESTLDNRAIAKNLIEAIERMAEQHETVVIEEEGPIYLAAEGE